MNERKERSISVADKVVVEFEDVLCHKATSQALKHLA